MSSSASSAGKGQEYAQALQTRERLAETSPLDFKAMDAVQRQVAKTFVTSNKSQAGANNRGSRGIAKLFATAEQLNASGTDVLVLVATNTTHAKMRAYATPRMEEVLNDESVRTTISNKFVNKRHSTISMERTAKTIKLVPNASSDDDSSEAEPQAPVIAKAPAPASSSSKAQLSSMEKIKALVANEAKQREAVAEAARKREEKISRKRAKTSDEPPKAKRTRGRPTSK